MMTKIPPKDFLFKAARKDFKSSGTMYQYPLNSEKIEHDRPI